MPDRSVDGGVIFWSFVSLLGVKSVTQWPKKAVDHRPGAGWAEVGSAANVQNLEADHRLVGPLHLRYPESRRVMVLGPRSETSTATLRGGYGQAQEHRVSQCQ